MIPSFLTLAEEERLLHCLQQGSWVDPRMKESHMYAPSAAATTPSALESDCSRWVAQFIFPVLLS